MKTILILEDNDESIAGFQAAVAKLGNGFELKIWRDAPSMVAECEKCFPATALISLQHATESLKKRLRTWVVVFPSRRDN